ncbi:hypothetical protein OG539_13170 [Actinacidiphila glaucinigra]|uniref:hypothetical protein n=1 Tax=Actinacidiphila glaucinigra TaxID=235986 RepID=UPI00325508B9
MAGSYDLNGLPLAQALWSAGFVLLLLRFRPCAGPAGRIPPPARLVRIVSARGRDTRSRSCSASP